MAKAFISPLNLLGASAARVLPMTIIPLLKMVQNLQGPIIQLPLSVRPVLVIGKARISSIEISSNYTNTTVATLCNKVTLNLLLQE